VPKVTKRKSNEDDLDENDDSNDKEEDDKEEGKETKVARNGKRDDGIR